MYQVSLESAPPFSVVISFFLNACVYLILAGILCALIFFNALDSAPSIHSLIATKINLRNCEIIALAHIFGIGFLLFIMFGALSQMLPVLASVRLSKPRFTSAISIIFLNLGLLIFICGFLLNNPNLNALGGILIAFGILNFALQIFFKIAKIRFFTPTIFYMIFALVSLIALASLGIIMLGAWLAWWNFESYSIIFALHIVFGAFGWIFLLIIGVALQVLPMFFIAPNFKAWQYKFICPILFLLILFSGDFRIYFIAIFAIFFGILGLKILNKRRRKSKDLGVNLWQFAFVNLIISGICFALNFLNLAIVLFLFGFVFGVVFSMLYKIVPFLSWFHLSFEGILELPNMRDFIPQDSQKRAIFALFFVYITAILCAFSVVFLIFLSIFLTILGAISVCHILKSYKKYKFLSAQNIN